MRGFATNHFEFLTGSNTLLAYNLPMQVTDFQWDSGATVQFPKHPYIVKERAQLAPPSGAFAILVYAAITEADEKAPMRYFICTVEAAASENTPGWEKLMHALLIKTCLERWHR